MKTDSVLIKFKCGVNLRRFRALIIDDEFELSVPEFKQKAIALFSLLDKSEHLVLTYIDEHGDEVSLVDEDDLSDVVKQRLDPMRISVYHHSSRRSLLPRMSQPENGNQLMVKKEAPKSSSFLCNNLNSCLVEDLKVDVTIRVAPSTPFKKIWRMKNIGRVEWPRKTELIWIGGDRLSNRSSFEVEVPLAGLPVGEEVDVVVDLTAPVIPDEYIAFWRLASPSGERFGQRIKVIVKGTIIWLLCMASDSVLGATLKTFNVMSYGASGNGRADDSQAFLKAWQAGCRGDDESSSSTPVVVVPPNKTFLLSPLTFKGPCKSPRIYMLVSGNLVAPLKSGWRGNQQQHAWIIFSSVTGLVVKGKGVIDGQGPSWWPDKPCFHDPANGVICKGPTGMIFNRCHGLRLNGFTKINGPGSHILVMATDDAVLNNLRIIAPGDSPNTDAIDISSSTRVKITNSFIATGDDCIAIGAGSSGIDVSGVTCGPGHGISIGSLGSGGFDVVQDVLVRNCTLKQTMTGVRIKTHQGGKGYARNISFRGIILEAVDNPIQIEQFYCPLKVNCLNYTSAVAISDVSFMGISGTSVASNVINLQCSNTVGCTNICLDRVYIRSTTLNSGVYATCNNAHGKAARTKPAVNCLLP